MIRIKNAEQNNLKHISLEFPKNQLIVITGVSGSGKSSLAFDLINKEGQRLFLINQSAQARKFLGKLEKAKVESITGLTPTISIGQNISNRNPRSTVGTYTEIYDTLRLLFARLGKTNNKNIKLNRSLFSFNSKNGACENCQGLGLEDIISLDLLIDDENKSIREGCFKIVNPDGYIIYSQVRMEELEKLCQANGFSVDTAWKDLNNEQQDIVLNGNDKIKILYGKHSLESRMKWTGIKANPREKEFYKGILPVMNEILRRDRNPNILRFAKTQICSKCNGSRLNNDAQSVKILGKNIFEYTQYSILELEQLLHINFFEENEKHIAEPIINSICQGIANLKQLGLEYLSLDRPISTLSGGEIQSIRLALQVNSKLNNITYVFDEPSVGLHPSKNINVIKLLKQLVAQGNTVIVVEHDAETIRNADWIIEIGPKAGIHGGELLFNGTKDKFFAKDNLSLTKDYLDGKKKITFNTHTKPKESYFIIKEACINNLKTIDVRIKKGALNVVTGVSGSGKSSLILKTLMPLIQRNYSKQINASGKPEIIDYDFKNLLFVNQAPIGKTARSTPATYTKVFDLIRDFYAKLPSAKAKKIKKTFFSFNTKGGRCETCEGAGKIEIGMHLLGNVESQCPTCKGQRYKENILSIEYQNKNISDVLEMSAEAAKVFFKGNPKIEKHLAILTDIGLAYLKLGQSSNTLSGGEAQRIRLASELVKNKTNNQLFIFDEPTTGLHFDDIQTLMNIFSELIETGNTILLIEHNEDVIRNAQHIIDLGPGASHKGGNLVFEGNYSDFIKCKTSITAQSLNKTELIKSPTKEENEYIELKGVNTNNLKNIDIKIPYHKHTVVNGKSGSGKSSLVFDTIFTEAQNAYAENFPSYIQQFTRQQSFSDVHSIKGLLPCIGLKQNIQVKDQRSTIGTLTNISENLRLLFSRFGTAFCPTCKTETTNDYCKKCDRQYINTKKASNYSYNHSDGACYQCKGLGEILTSTPELLIADKKLSFSEGALVKSKLLDSYVNPKEKYMATLLEVGQQMGFDYQQEIEELSKEAINIAFYGAGEREFDVEWEFKTKSNSGIHKFKGKWIGFEGLLLEEYYRRHANGKGAELLEYLNYKVCPNCSGERLKTEILAVKIQNKNIYDLSIMPFNGLQDFLNSLDKSVISQQLLENLQGQIQALIDFNLSYLQLNRKSNSLSGGELQRVMLSSQLKDSLTGLCYILDEPSSGLHPQDVQIIISKINNLVRNGNTVITVEHQEDIINAAENLISLGPGSGIDGGRIIKDKPELETEIEVEVEIEAKGEIKIKGAFVNNLKYIDVDFKINQFNVLTGTSGSGKTSLMRDILYKSRNNAHNCISVSGLNIFDNLLWIDRSVMQKSAISSLVSYLGILDDIKKSFSYALKGSDIKIAELSYNNKKGQCPDCKGQGFIKTKLDFLNDVQSVCETCRGDRYRAEILEIKLRNKNIAGILRMTVLEAIAFFSDEKKIVEKLNILNELGLSYLKLGQNSTEFSGGEAQRLKIAKNIISNPNDKYLYIFDEASRGIHSSELHYLIRMFNKLLKEGHTVIAIEHNPNIIKKAQYIVDLHEGKLTYQGNIENINGTLIEKYL